MMKAKGDGGEGLYMRGRSDQRDMEHGTYSAWSKSQVRSSRLRCNICQSEDHLKRDCPRYNYKKSQGFVRNEDLVSGSGVDGECRVRGLGEVQVQMRNGSSFVLDNAVTRKTLKGRKQLKEYQSGWKIRTARDRKQHSAQELFGYGEDSNEDAFLVAAMDKIYAHELLTFNDTAALKEDMDARSDVYVLSNGCRKSSDDRNDYYYEYTPGFTTGSWYILCWRDTPYCRWRVVYEGTVMLKRMVSGHAYMRLEARSIKWSARDLTLHLQMWVDDTRMCMKLRSYDVAHDGFETAYMTLTEAAKEAIWLKGLAKKSGFELKIVAGIAT
nr:zinc finger, CCHC-type [Tanacetum cinerariifolium]